MRVNHGRAVASLSGSQVLVCVQGKMICAKGVAQAIALAYDLRSVAQGQELLLPKNVNACGSDRTKLRCCGEGPQSLSLT